MARPVRSDGTRGVRDVAGWALSRYDTRSVLVAVLGAKTVAVVAFAAAALAEQSSLRPATVDSRA